MAALTPDDTPKSAVVNDTTAAATILVVDDEEEARRLLASLLSHKGYHTIFAVNGREALEAVEREKPDLVVLDIMMPEMSGLAALQAIRERYHTAELPVILLTALGDSKDVVRGLELGANDYLGKPIDTAELAARVRTALRLKKLHDQYRAGLDRLRELDELKDRFLQIAAHDMKSPLGTILMGLQILSDSISDVAPVVPDYERVINMMTYSSSIIQNIIDDYLDLQTIKAGRLELDTQAISINTLIKTIVEQFQPYADSKGITLQTELDRSVPTCPADPDRLMQVLSNLVSNAIKFSPRDSAIVVRTLPCEDGARVEVIDRGPGIKPEEQYLLFQEFVRLSNRPTGGEKSSGVGLAISRYLIEAHRGRIGVQSAPGEGSTFWFELPC